MTDGLTTAERRLLKLLNDKHGSTSIAGIVECRAALSLVARGQVRIENSQRSSITTEGGSGFVHLQFCEAPTHAQMFGSSWASTTHGCSRRATTRLANGTPVCGQHHTLLTKENA